MAVEMSTTALGKMFGFADITSRTYNVPVVWHGIANPALVVALIQLYVERAKSSHAGLEMDAMQAALDQQIDGDRDGKLAANLHQYQLAVIPPITFRKHWVILFARPGFLSLSVPLPCFLTGGLTKRWYSNDRTGQMAARVWG